ncbi:MAG: hypothetical protein ACREGE_02430 [Candidatus Microsaccharimonas sp.]
MDSTPHLPPEGIGAIYEWFKKAQIHYDEQYVWLYISYNAWYQAVTHTTNDRQALGALKKRFVIWDDYINGRALQNLRPYMERLAEFTQREPLMTKTIYWSGSVESPNDWRSLIEFWYQVRCTLVHGARVRPRYVWLAYETLTIFMEEIIDRMHQCFTQDDLSKMKEINTLAAMPTYKTERFKQLQEHLYQKYIASPNIWDVDMKRVSEDTP